MATWIDFAMAHPFLSIIALLTIVLIIVSGIISLIRKDSIAISDAGLGAVILWIIVGFGYVLFGR